MHRMSSIYIVAIIMLQLLCTHAGEAGDGRNITWVNKSTTSGDLQTPVGNQQTASLVLDINNDGITDFVITDRSEMPSVVWYESSGDATWTRHTIDNTMLHIEAGGDYHDIDGDGDLDIVMGGDYKSNEVWWWENPYPNYDNPWVRRLIKNDGPNKHHDQMFGDFDGDGKVELVFWNQKVKKLFLAEIPADVKNAEVWSYTEIYNWVGGKIEHEGFAQADIDGDGKTDIVGGGRWFKHNGGYSYTANVIDASQAFGRCVAGQLIEGGYAEVVFGPGDNVNDLKLYQYDGKTWSATTLKEGVDHGHSIGLADFDGDGKLDIFNAEMRLNGGNENAKTLIFFNNGDGSFEKSVVATGYGNHESRAADLDGDGDIDILGKPYNWEAPRLDIWINDGSKQARLPIDKWERHLVDGEMPANSVFIEAGDLNGDGKVDLTAGGWWWENSGSLAGGWTRHEIGSPLNNMLIISDFDGDNDLDIFGTEGVGAGKNHDFVWARNDSKGNFTILDNIDTGGDGDFVQGRVLADFGSGRQIALSWHKNSGGIHVLTLPDDTSGSNWAFSTLSDTTLKENLTTGDIDGDGYLDLLLGTVWLRNSPNGFETFTLGDIKDLDDNAEPDRNELADINGDGRLDAVVSLEKGTHVLWFEAPADPTQLWTRHIVGEVEGQGFSMDVADFDNDGDEDIVIGEHRGKVNNRVIIFQNENGGQSWTMVVIDTDVKENIDHHDGTRAVDLDLDGDLDIISIGWYNRKVWVYENKAVDGD